MRKLFVFTALVLIVYACSEAPNDSPGRQLAETYCANCHQLPEPEDLTRQIWSSTILPKMGAYLGQYGNSKRTKYLGTAGERAYLESLFPTESLVDSLDWQILQAYYLDNAPSVLKEKKPDPIILEMDRFTVEPVYDPADSTERKSATLIQFDAATGEIRTGGDTGTANVFRIFDSSGQLTNRTFTSSVPSAYDPASGILVEMGSLPPSDHPRGTLRVHGDSTSNTQPLADSLARPVDMARVDLNQDGNKELVLAEYGNLVGRLSTWLVSPEGKLTKNTILAPTPGVVRLRIADMDGDGHDDLLALFAQGDERVELWYSRPGKPLRQRLLRFPPSYGSSDFQVCDFDQDGHLDLVVEFLNIRSFSPPDFCAVARR